MSTVIETSGIDKKLTLRIKGELDFNSYTKFVSAYRETNGVYETYIIDMQECEYIDSSALGMLLEMEEYLGENADTIRLTKCTDVVYQALKISKFTKRFHVEACG